MPKQKLKPFLVRDTEDKNDQGHVLWALSHQDAVNDWLGLFSTHAVARWESEGTVIVWLLEQEALKEDRHELLVSMHFTTF